MILILNNSIIIMNLVALFTRHPPIANYSPTEFIPSGTKRARKMSYLTVIRVKNNRNSSLTIQSSVRN